MRDFLLPNWPAPHNVRTVVTTRKVGNLAAYVGNDVAQVLQNRDTIRRQLNLPSEPCWLKQQHTNHVIAANPNLIDPIADASFTKEKNVICVALTADCLPILICDQAGTTVAAIHAGWRGLAGGIIETTLKAISIDAQQLLVWFGPAISVDAYVVGEEVRQKFIKQDKGAAKAFVYSSDNNWHANLYLLARMRLNALGVTTIYGGEFCTYIDKDLFFSYRREQDSAGRMASLIWLK